MIYIDFKIDEHVLKEDLEENIPTLNHIIFASTIFIMPARMRIDDVELFEYKNDPWCEAPIMNIASSGLLTIKDLKFNRVKYWSIIEGPGDIEFTMLDKNNVKVDFNSGSRHVIVTAKYEELLEAFQDFANRVRKFMWERVPQLNEHPYWGPWLRAERD